MSNSTKKDKRVSKILLTWILLLALNEKLSENYNKRISKMIWELVDEPVIIKDLEHKVENTRQAFLEENKIIGIHEFVFNQYQNTKQRIVTFIPH